MEGESPTLKANLNLNKFENFSIQFDWQSIISIQSFFNMMGWKQSRNHFQMSESFIYVKIWFFCLIRKVGFCLSNVNLQVPKCFATYRLPYIYLTIWHQLFSSSDWSTLDFFLPTWPTCCNLPRTCTPVKYKAKEKAGFCNQMSGGKRVREENRLTHTVK